MTFWHTLVAASALILVDAAPIASLSAGSPEAARDSTATIRCEPGAVFINIDRAPGTRFERVGRVDGPLGASRDFTFSAGPIRQVQVYLSATLPEEGVGMSSAARLSVLVETTPRNPAAPVAWWRLVPPAPGDSGTADDAAEELLFDANAIRPCFDGEGPCSFAELAPAADSATALLVLGLSRDLGGANASNWEHKRLVLDFRGELPRVAVAVECAYNEGGGVCTAIESGQRPRLDLNCGWDGPASDFVCTETSSDLGHRDFSLFTGRRGGPREGEVATLEEAARRLATRAPGSVEILTGVGPVRHIQEVSIGSVRLMVLASGGDFHIVDRTADGIGAIYTVRSRPLYPNPAGPPTVPEPATNAWTGRFDPVYQAGEIFRNAAMVVLRVVEARRGGAAPHAYAMYWLAISVRGKDRTAELLEVVMPAYDAWCGDEVTPMVVTAIGRVGSSFDVPITVQPAARTSGKGDLNWDGAEEGEDVVRCRQPGRVRWRNGAFEVTVSERPCAKADPPQFVTLGLDGTIRLSDAEPPPGGGGAEPLSDGVR